MLEGQAGTCSEGVAIDDCPTVYISQIGAGFQMIISANHRAKGHIVIGSVDYDRSSNKDRSGIEWISPSRLLGSIVSTVTILISGGEQCFDGIALRAG